MKRDYLRLGLIILIMAVTSCNVEDTRTMRPPKEPTMVKEINELIIEQLEQIEEDEEVIEVEMDPQEDIEPEEETIEAEIEGFTEYEEIIEEEVYIEEDEEVYTEEYYEDPALIYLGEYRITAYEWTGNPCANGNYPTEGYTIACNDLPMGTEVYIEGVGWRTVEDTGGGGSEWIDLYLGDVSACYEWGVQYRSVYINGFVTD